MASNKHALIRYRVIDKCLRQVDMAWNWKSLAEACSKELEKVVGHHITLSERTIKSDLSNMRHDEALGYFAPIEYDRKEKSYYYSRRDYSITEAPLNKSDSTELRGAISLLRQFTGFAHLNGIENVIKKLELLAYESATESKKIVHLAQPNVIPGQIWLDELYNAIKEEKALSMSYKGFGKKATNYIISPYMLKEYENRWYLYAWLHSKDQLRTYGLERITELKPSLQDYIPNETFDPENYFSDVIGITKDQKNKPIKITFKVYGNTTNYIRTKPLHPSQIEVQEEKDASTFTIKVVSNYELESTILSYGESIEILTPKALRQKISRRIEKMKMIY